MRGRDVAPAAVIDVLQPVEVEFGEEVAAALGLGDLLSAYHRADGGQYLASAFVRHRDEREVLDIQCAGTAFLEDVDDVAPGNQAAEAVRDHVDAVVAAELLLHEGIEGAGDLVDAGVVRAAAGRVAEARDVVLRERLVRFEVWRRS